jgi:hypothetical protein
MAKSDPIWEIRPTCLDSNLTWFDFFQKVKLIWICLDPDTNDSKSKMTRDQTTQNPTRSEPNDPKLEMTRDQAIWSPTWSKPEWPKIQDDLRSNDPKPNLIRTRITRSMPERPKIWDYPRLDNPKSDLIRLVLHIYIYIYI